MSKRSPGSDEMSMQAGHSHCLYPSVCASCTHWYPASSCVSISRSISSCTWGLDTHRWFCVHVRTPPSSAKYSGLLFAYLALGTAE